MGSFDRVIVGSFDRRSIGWWNRLNRLTVLSVVVIFQVGDLAVGDTKSQTSYNLPHAVATLIHAPPCKDAPKCRTVQTVEGLLNRGTVGSFDCRTD